VPGRTAVLGFVLALGQWTVTAQTTPGNQPREEIVIPNFEASGWILDLGGGCRGTIGRMKPDQVVAIDISERELKEAPNTFLKIVIDASDLSITRRDRTLDPAYYTALAKECGFEVVSLTEQESPGKTFFLELRRP